MLVHTPVSVGELADKITILQIKKERITDLAKLRNIQYEFDVLQSVWNERGLREKVNMADLYYVNETLWDIEDKIRIKESKREFDDEFIWLARAVYKTNDKRAQLKKQINEQVGSTLVEEKSYAHT